MVKAPAAARMSLRLKGYRVTAALCAAVPIALVAFAGAAAADISPPPVEATPRRAAAADSPEAEMALLQPAIEHHRRAQHSRKRAVENPTDRALQRRTDAEYRLASEGYARYLARFADSKQAYQVRFYQAEAFYFSGRFAEAVEQYEQVRDSTRGDQYREEAAWAAMKSYERLVDRKVAAHELTLPPIPETGKLRPPFTPLPVPETVRKLQNSMDEYARLFPQWGRVPDILYRAAEIDFKYLDFAKVRPRMQRIVEKFCPRVAGAEAGAAIATMYEIEGNLDEARRWRDKVREEACGSETRIWVN